MKEKISVIITTYGRTNELKRALNSILNQTYNNLEILIIDDNKDDSISKQVFQIIKSYNDPRIIYIKNKTNLGGALSRNVGIDNSSGNYIAFLDDDDEYLPDKIKKQYECFINSKDDKLALVYCYCKSVKNDKTVSVYKYDYIGNCLAQAMKGCFAATSQWMCKKEYLSKVDNFSDVPCKQDSTVLVKLLAAGYSVDRVPEILSLYHEEDIPRISSNNVQKRIIGLTKLLELCRENYDKISSTDRKEIEYSFATEMIIYYFVAGDTINYKNCLKTMNKIHRFGKKAIEAKINILKKRIKKILLKG